VKIATFNINDVDKQLQNLLAWLENCFDAHPKYKLETIANPTQPFDALYLIDAMKSATLIEGV
jgi:exonuclease III